MQDQIHLAAHMHVFGDIAVHQLKARSGMELSEVLRCAGQEIVQAGHVPAAVEQGFTSDCPEIPRPR